MRRLHLRWIAAALLGSWSLIAQAEPESKTALGDFKVTYYWVVSESRFSGAADTSVLDLQGRSLGRFPRAFVKALELEGTAVTRDGRTLNYAGRRAGSTRFSVVSAPYGLGSKSNPLIPFRSLATDPSEIPYGTVLYIPEAVGAKLPDGTTHDGYFVAADTGGAIKGKRLDVFTGLNDQRQVFTDAGLSNLRFHKVYKVKGGPARPYLTELGSSAPRWEPAPREEPSSPAPVPPTGSSATSNKGKVTATSLNLRSGPGTDKSVLTSLPKNSEVEILEKRDGWLRVKAGGREGWVSDRFVAISSPGAAGRLGED